MLSKIAMVLYHCIIILYSAGLTRRFINTSRGSYYHLPYTWYIKYNVDILLLNIPMPRMYNIILYPPYYVYNFALNCFRLRNTVTTVTGKINPSTLKT